MINEHENLSQANEAARRREGRLYAFDFTALRLLSCRRRPGCGHHVVLLGDRRRQVLTGLLALGRLTGEAKREAEAVEQRESRS